MGVSRHLGRPARLALAHFHRADRLLALNEILFPAAGIEGRVNQLGARVRFREEYKVSRKGLD